MQFLNQNYNRMPGHQTIDWCGLYSDYLIKKILSFITLPIPADNSRDPINWKSLVVIALIA